MDFLVKTPISDSKGQIQQQLEKFKQQTQYVCLKLGCKDWMTFLTDLRTGNIIKKCCTPLQSIQNTIKPLQLPFPERNKAQQPSFDAMFNDILQSMSTKRSTGKEKFGQIESPICSQAGVKRIMGNQTERSQCSSASFPNVNELNEVQTCQKLIQEVKQDHILDKNNKTLLNEVIKNLQKYDGCKTIQIPQGFDTFRVEGCEPLDRNENYNSEQSINQEVNQSTAKRHNRSQLRQIEESSENDLSKISSQQWIRQSIDQETGIGMKQFLLALQNTKLRRQIKVLSKMLKQKDK